MNICDMLKKNSYRKNSRNSLVFVPLNGVLIKRIPPKNRARPIAYIFASKYFNIHLHPSGKKYRTYLIWYRLIS